MKRKLNHIALLLLVVFGITVLPFNALHTHAEDEHHEVLYGHQHEAEEHHCELDVLTCQDSLKGECSHGSHIHSTFSKCFSCEFHFIKHYETATLINHVNSNPVVVLLNPDVNEMLASSFLDISNKGPPQFPAL